MTTLASPWVMHTEAPSSVEGSPFSTDFSEAGSGGSEDAHMFDLNEELLDTELFDSEAAYGQLDPVPADLFDDDEEDEDVPAERFVQAQQEVPAVSAAIQMAQTAVITAGVQPQAIATPRLRVQAKRLIATPPAPVSQTAHSAASSQSASDDDDDDATRAKRELRRQKNREAANRSRLRRKQEMSTLAVENKGLRREKEELRQQVIALQSENRELRRQVEYFKSILSSGAVAGAAGAVAAAAATPAVAPSDADLPTQSRKRVRVTGRQAAAGVAMMAIVFAFAFSFSSVPFLQTANTLVAGLAPASSSAASTTAGVGARNLLTVPKSGMMAAVSEVADAPPMPRLLSPTAAITFFLYSMGITRAAETVLFHSFIVAAVGCAVFRLWSSNKSRISTSMADLLGSSKTVTSRA